MATTTTNYGWAIPQSTDLVKDGATAIATLGSAIDTSINTALGTKKAGMVLLNTTSFSAVASQSINDVFSATYDNYLILITAEGSTSGIDINMRLRVSGTDNSSTNYTRSQIFQSSTTISGQSLTGQTSWGGVSYATTGQRQFSQIIVVNPFATQYTGLVRDAIDAINGSTTQLRSTFGSTITTSYTGFTLLASTGNITGNVSVYGFNK
jgi:hypothetical protein